MKKHKLIYTTFLLTAISCSNFKPLILSAYLDPKTTTNVTYDDLNFSYALFNQYGSGLSYTLIQEYSAFNTFIRDIGVGYQLDGVFTWINTWDTITGTSMSKELNALERNAFNTILFDRDFNRTTKKAITTNYLRFISHNVNNVYHKINIRSKISYNVSVGSVYLAFKNLLNINVDFVNVFIQFKDVNNKTLQTILLDDNRSNTNLDRKYDLPTIITGVRSFDLWWEWVDVPPFSTVGFGTETRIHEFNLFTQNQEISIPSDTGGDIFGFEFVAVEWWDILGHLQNFAWWIVNKSPISPLFEWIEDYVITWLSGLITFITGVFRL